MYIYVVCRVLQHLTLPCSLGLDRLNENYKAINAFPSTVKRLLRGHPRAGQKVAS